MIIGITGNSGTGKTSICKALEKNKINGKTPFVIDADRVVKKMSAIGEEYYNQIISTFGKEVLQENQELNRAKLAGLVFVNEEKRELLNQITYNYVAEEIKKQAKESKCNFVIIDAPLLIESKLNKICDVVISVIADKETKLKRIIERDIITEKTALDRLNAQKEDEFYIKNSNLVIVNNEIDLEKQAKEIIELLNSNILYNKEIVIIQNGDLKILQFKKLIEYKNLVHAFTLKPFDFGSNITYKEKEQEVKDNYKEVCNLLNVDFENIVRPYQTHTKNVVALTGEHGIFSTELENVDGLITDKTNKSLSLVFADCTPIYLFDKNKNVIAAIHSGWEGTLKQIIKGAVNKMIKEFSCNPKDIICAIGPTIRKCHFEVDEDVKDRFCNMFKDICKEEQFVRKAENKQKYYIDTVYLNKQMLIDSGIPEQNIIDSNICTVCNNKILHSYRVEKENSGRSTAIISLK